MTLLIRWTMAEKDEYRHDLGRLVWKFNSPTWDFDEATYDRTAQAFSNPDYVAIVIDNYRWRPSPAKGDPQYDGLEKRLAEAPVIGVPTITIDGDYDPFTPPEMARPTVTSFQESTRTGRRRSATTSRRRRPRPSLKPLPTWTVSDRGRSRSCAP